MVEVEEFVTHFVVVCDYQAYFAAAKWVTYIKVDDTSVSFALEVGVGYSITCA